MSEVSAGQVVTEVQTQVSDGPAGLLGIWLQTGWQGTLLLTALGSAVPELVESLQPVRLYVDSQLVADLDL